MEGCSRQVEPGVEVWLVCVKPLELGQIRTIKVRAPKAKISELKYVAFSGWSSQAVGVAKDSDRALRLFLTRPPSWSLFEGARGASRT